jgi:hypothetical protein
LLHSQINEEANRRSQALSASFYGPYNPYGSSSFGSDLAMKTSVGTAAPKSIEEVLKDLKTVKEKFDFERKVYHKKLKLESQTRSSFEHLVKRLADEVEDSRRKTIYKNQSDNELTERVTALERQLREERAKCATLERDLQYSESTAAQSYFVY